MGEGGKAGNRREKRSVGEGGGGGRGELKREVGGVEIEVGKGRKKKLERVEFCVVP